MNIPEAMNTRRPSERVVSGIPQHVTGLPQHPPAPEDRGANGLSSESEPGTMSGVPEPIQYGQSWWWENSDGRWLRWNEREGTWEPQDTTPPPAGDSIGLFRPLGTQRLWAVWLLGLAIAVDVAGIAVGYLEYSLLHRIGRGDPVTFIEASASDTRVAIVGLFQLVLLIGAAIAFIIWFRRAYGNLHPLGVRTLRFKLGWAVGGWFVPFLNLWRPKQIANDLWRGSDPVAPPDQGAAGQRQQVSPLLTWWWSLWIAASVAGYVAGRMTMALDEAATIEELMTGSATNVFVDILSAISGILAIAVVNALTDRQEKRRTNLQQRLGMHPGASSALGPEHPG